MPFVFSVPGSGARSAGALRLLTMTALRILRLGLGLQLCRAALASAAEAPQPFTWESEAPYHARWGQYSVSVALVSEDRRRFRITDRSGNVLREIEASYVESVDYPDLSGRGR